MPNGKVIAICNQKGGVTKTTTTANLGIGLAMQGKKVLLIDADPQGDLTTSLGWPDNDSLPITLTTIMDNIIHEREFDPFEGILHHDEGVDLIPSNIELSGMEMTLVTAMSREITLREYLSRIKQKYDYAIIDCMPILQRRCLQMAQKLNLNLPSADDLFSTQAERDDEQREKIVDIPISEIDDFPDHPYPVEMDEEMESTVESVKAYGVHTPALVRPKEDGRYEMVSGHRRKMASILAERETLPCIVRKMSHDEATVIMVDSNLQREKIPPSAKAKAYKMKLDAIRRQQGERTDLTSATVLQKSGGKSSREIMAEKSPDSHEQIRKYIRLEELIPEVLKMVDMGKIAMRPAVELSYLPAEQQQSLLDTMEAEDCTPSHAQAIKLRQFSEEGRLDENVMLSIMQEEKPNQKEQFKIPKEKISRFFVAVYGLGIGIYLSTRRNTRPREEHGSAKWGDTKAINRKYADKAFTANKILTQNVRIGFNARKHRRNLNVLVCGGSGASLSGKRN